ncbi:hypothetical protein G4B88_014898 [Cannabis sativa]|uniref:SP-RING-type domain-containing protein n=1 Tax=Cannabis sativa TaxID=3483 RepID=A0A7J6IA09_CANSA|nr:hypothetical protein G4B88_014898 [Cannabis sativa]
MSETTTAFAPREAVVTAGFPKLNSSVCVASSTFDLRFPAAIVNAYRISNVMDRLATILRHQRVDTAEFFNLCLTLARGIDYAVANNFEATRSQDLSAVVKQICERRSDHSLQAMIMVVMISVKNACKVGWFPEKETRELYTLANEIGMFFSSQGGHNTAPSCVDSNVATMGHILVSLDVKPGYGIYTVDFNILKNNVQSQEDKIRLFVAQVDNVETSACIITPQQVNFIVNGRGVDKRTNVYVDAGPQVPTNVTPLLKYGTNLLQAVGQFNGHYVIIVAFMKETKLSDIPVLSDYVQPLAGGLQSDLDLIEGPSRISLNCPISYTRIGTPVKGHSCKHLQCFDFSNYIDINSRRPSWRCPHCNQHVCYSDIRIDQNMVLKEVGNDVAVVIISTDGSWKAVMDNDDQSDKAHDSNCSKQTIELQESTEPNDIHNILDLTGGDDDEMDITVSNIDDLKPSRGELNVLPRNQNVGAPQVEDTDWSALFNSPDLSTAVWSEALFGPTSQSTPATFVQTPHLADVSPVPTNHGAGGLVNSNLTASEMMNHFSSPNFQLQQMQSTNPNTNEYGRFPTSSPVPNRTPIAIQALAAQPQTPQTSQQILRNNSNFLTPNSSAMASQSAPTGYNTVFSDMERRQHFNQSLINRPQAPNVAPSSAQPSYVTQNRNHQHQDRSFSGQRPNGYRPSTLSNFQNSHLQETFNNVRIPQSHAIRPSHMLRSPVPYQGVTQLGTPQVSQVSGNQQARMAGLAAQRDAHAARQDSTPEQNWLAATARMRGSSIPPALNNLIIRPTQSPQPSQAPILPSTPATSPQMMLPQMTALLANNDRNVRALQPHNHIN